jgi:hypothetical protein
MDVLAVRFPQHQEPEREVQPCPFLAIPPNHVDFLVGEGRGIACPLPDRNVQAAEQAAHPTALRAGGRVFAEAREMSLQCRRFRIWERGGAPL